jgi:hypothetical protein
MNKTLLTLTASILALSSYAQNTSWTTNGNIGIGITSPAATLHVLSGGTNLNTTSQYSGNLVIEGKSGPGRSSTAGSSLEFAVPANLDGSNPWGQGRIMTVAGNTTNSDATGKMIFGTRRMFDKLGVGSSLWNYGDDLVIDGAGQVGVGITMPKARFHVSGRVLIQGANIDSRFSEGNDLSYLRNSGQMLIGCNRSAGGGETDFISNQGSGVTGGFSFYNYNNSGVTSHLMSIQANGSVGIGTDITNGYKLAVKGNVIATSIKVQLMDVWPDYVFESNYKRMSLPELEKYVKSEKHLPEIPSAQVLTEGGIDLGEMNGKLLKKIEELTLYLIEQNKQIELLKEKVNNM